MTLLVTEEHLKNLDGVLSRLDDEKSTKWKWGPEEKETFQKAKALLSSPRLLVHFDPEKKLVLSCDASAYGLGVVLSHWMEDRAEQPISYASRTLTSAEKKNSQLDKEALAVVYGVTKFHQYLYGHDFTLFTGHKALTYLFSSDRAVPQMGFSRLQRWALTLSSYRYSVVFRRGRDNSNADALSRLPLPDSPLLFLFRVIYLPHSR